MIPATLLVLLGVLALAFSEVVKSKDLLLPTAAVKAFHPKADFIRISKTKVKTQGTAGFFYAKFYEDQMCNTYTVFTFGFNTGTCLNLYSNNGATHGSLSFDLSDYSSIVGNVYTSLDCSGTPASLAYETNTCKQQKPTMNDNDRYGYIFGFYPGTTVPSNNLGANSVVVTGFEGTTNNPNHCSASPAGVASFFATYTLDHCFAHGQHSSFALECSGSGDKTISALLFDQSGTCNYNPYRTTTINTGCFAAQSTNANTFNAIVGVEQIGDLFLPGRKLEAEAVKEVNVEGTKADRMIEYFEEFGQKVSHMPKMSTQATTGYFAISGYTASDCSGDAAVVAGRISNACTDQYDQDGKVIGSVNLVCSGTTAYLQQYTAGSCTGTSRTSVLQLNQCRAEQYGMYSNAVCSNAATPPVANGYAGQYNYDDTSGICASNPISYQMYKAGSCLNYGNYSIQSTCDAQGGYSRTIYNGNGCTQARKTEGFQGECLLADTFAYDDYEISAPLSTTYYFRKICTVTPPTYDNDDFFNANSATLEYAFEYMNISCVAAAVLPTRAPVTPVVVPTPGPTVANVIQMSVTQTFSNISITDFNSNANSETVIEATTAYVLSSQYINSNNVRIISVVSGSSNRRLQDSAGSIVVSYVVTSNNPAVTYSSLSGTLYASISSGTYSTTLAKTANYYKVPALVFASTSVSGFDSTDINSTPVTDDDDSSDYLLSRPALVGVTIAVIIGAELLIYAIYRFFFYKPSTAGDFQGNDLQNPIYNGGKA